MSRQIILHSEAEAEIFEALAWYKRAERSRRARIRSGVELCREVGFASAAQLARLFRQDETRGVSAVSFRSDLQN